MTLTLAQLSRIGGFVRLGSEGPGRSVRVAVNMSLYALAKTSVFSTALPDRPDHSLEVELRLRLSKLVKAKVTVIRV